MEWKRITAPFNREEVSGLRAGDRVLLNGYVYTARDAGHKRMYDAILSGGEMPIDLQGQVIYYVGA